MARAPGRPPSSARAIAAFNCGIRMAEWDGEQIGHWVAAGESITEYMTPAELMAFRLSPDSLWWRWWNRGWQTEKGRQRGFTQVRSADIRDSGSSDARGSEGTG